MSTDPQCRVRGCTSGKPAVWCPAMRLYARRGTEPARARASLRVCDDCRETVTLDEIVNDEAWEQITEVFRLSGKAAPKRELTELDFDFVDLDEDPEDDFQGED